MALETKMSENFKKIRCLYRRPMLKKEGGGGNNLKEMWGNPRRKRRRIEINKRIRYGCARGATQGEMGSAV